MMKHLRKNDKMIEKTPAKMIKWLKKHPRKMIKWLKNAHGNDRKYHEKMPQK